MKRGCGHRRTQRGAVLLMVLAFILVGTLAATTMVTSWQSQLRREKEEQLLFAGDQIRRAILSYYNTVPPGGTRALPPNLDALLSDTRFPTPRQHLRRLYTDPLTGAADWQLVMLGGGLAGVSSRSSEKPLKQAGFAQGYEHFSSRAVYSDWVFSIKP